MTQDPNTTPDQPDTDDQSGQGQEAQSEKRSDLPPGQEEAMRELREREERGPRFNR